jgi:hypothetical protein
VSASLATAIGPSSLAQGGGIFDAVLPNGPFGGPLALVNSAVTHNILSGRKGATPLQGGGLTHDLVPLAREELAGGAPERGVIVDDEHRAAHAAIVPAFAPPHTRAAPWIIQRSERRQHPTVVGLHVPEPTPSPQRFMSATPALTACRTTTTAQLDSDRRPLACQAMDPWRLSSPASGRPEPTCGSALTRLVPDFSFKSSSAAP